MEATCYICGGHRFVDDHHIDCCEGKLSPETVPLCRRCHRTYHDLGVDWFEDEYLDKVIEIENKRREIQRAHAHGNIFGAQLQPMTRADVKRSEYWNKTHGIKQLPKARDEIGGQSKGKTRRPRCTCGATLGQIGYISEDGYDPLLIEFHCPVCGLHIWIHEFVFLKKPLFARRR